MFVSFSLLSFPWHFFLHFFLPQFSISFSYPQLFLVSISLHLSLHNYHLFFSFSFSTFHTISVMFTSHFLILLLKLSQFPSPATYSYFQRLKERFLFINILMKKSFSFFFFSRPLRKYLTASFTRKSCNGGFFRGGNVFFAGRRPR